MHPIERLRAVARADWAPADVLAAEAAWALGELATVEPHALLPACRRLLERHPGCGPLWWVCARMLCAGDPVPEAHRCIEELDADPTVELLEEALDTVGRAVRHGGVGDVASAEVVVVEAVALGADAMVVDPDDQGLLAAARAVEVPIWVEAGVGRSLPGRLFAAALRRLEDRSDVRRRHDAAPPAYGHRRHVVEPLTGVAQVVGPQGAAAVTAALARTDCPEPPELLAPW